MLELAEEATDGSLDAEIADSMAACGRTSTSSS
jgi:hypothetical protein